MENQLRVRRLTKQIDRVVFAEGQTPFDLRLSIAVLAASMSDYMRVVTRLILGRTVPLTTRR